MIRVVLFDLDETLYPRWAGIMEQLGILLVRFMNTRLGIPAEEAQSLRRQYFQTYGTTMRGLQIHHQIDPDDFLSFVHDIPLDQYIQPNPKLDAALAAITYDKVVFTNASREHAERVLAILGISHHFSRIIDVRDVGYESKPQKNAYLRACHLLGVAPEECIIVEDNVRNLRPAKALGMTTVLVDGHDQEDVVDYTIAQIEDIAHVLQALPGGH
jgi:putative hydrolase of the HAD superfamily